MNVPLTLTTVMLMVIVQIQKVHFIVFAILDIPVMELIVQVMRFICIM